MQDRYLFRGNRFDNGEGVEGFFDVVTKGTHLDPIENGYYITTFKKLENGEIILTGRYEINPATIGQCTGLRDKNGKLIFEGDIVKQLDPSSDTYETKHVKFEKTDIQTEAGELFFGYFLINWGECEIIDNIHDKANGGTGHAG